VNRVALYLGVLVVLFAAAFALGKGIGGDDEEVAQHGPETSTEAEHAGAGHGEEIGGSHGEAARGPGATDAHDLKLKLRPEGTRIGEEIAFQILDAAGDPITKFEVEHTKQVHLIVVSTDLEHFQHVHPAPGHEGVWHAAVSFPAAGEYRVIADVKYGGRKQALSADLTVDVEPTAVGQPVADAQLKEQDLKAGQPTTLEFDAPPTEEYLGAAGHLVILSEGDLEYLHVHPHDDALKFEATFPKPGKYVLFLEAKRDGKVQTSRFPVSVG
jgi:hypothetical protein